MPTAIDPTNVGVSNQSTWVCSVTGGNTLFYNTMQYDTIYLSYNSAIVPGANTIPVAPLSTATMDTSTKGVYAICPTNNAAILVVAPGATGIRSVQPSTPSIETLSPLAVLINVPIAAGGSLVVAQSTFGGHIPIARFTSLVATIFAQAQFGVGLGTTPYYRVRSQWSFSNDNFDPLITDDWVFSTSPVSFTNNRRHNWSAQTFGDTLTMTVTNYDTQPLNLTIGLFGSYRSRPTSVMGRYPDDLTAEASGLGTDDILLSYQDVAIAAGAVGNPQLIPAYAGDVVLTGQLSGEAAAGTALVRIKPQPQSIIAGQIIVRTSALVGGNGYFNQPSFKLPRRVCTLTLDNTSGTAAVTPNIMLVGSSPI